MSEEKRNLRSWAVKLPEETIQEIERLFDSSGIRFKNEFVEHLISQYKFDLVKDGQANEDLLHPEVMKSVSREMYDLARLSQKINGLFISQVEKWSTEQYEYERLQKELQQKTTELKHVQSPSSTSGSLLHRHLLQIVQDVKGHMLYQGTSGVGKTNAMKLEIEQALSQNRPVFIVDPSGEYQSLCQEYQGQMITFASNSVLSASINPLEFRPSEPLEGQNPLVEKMLFVCSFIESLIMRTLSGSERKCLLDAIEKTYLHFGITRHTTSTDSLKMPLLLDLDQTLRKTSEGISLADEIEPFIFGWMNVFNNHRNFHVEKAPIYLFDIKEMSRELSTPTFFAVLEFIQHMTKKQLFSNALLVVDEVWTIVTNPQITDFFTTFLSQMNQYGMQCLCSTQQVRDLWANAENMCRQFETLLIFKQHVNDVGFTKEKFDFSTEQSHHLKHLKQGEAFVYIPKHNHRFMMTYEKRNEPIVDEYIPPSFLY